jgi:hypothetical protein
MLAEKVNLLEGAAEDPISVLVVGKVAAVRLGVVEIGEVVGEEIGATGAVAGETFSEEVAYGWGASAYERSTPASWGLG